MGLVDQERYDYFFVVLQTDIGDSTIPLFGCIGEDVDFGPARIWSFGCDAALDVESFQSNKRL